MLSNYEYLLSKCPWWLKKNNNVKYFYKSVALLFDKVDETYNLLEKQHLIDYAKGSFLDDLGVKFNVARNNETDYRYRNRIKLAMKKSELVPNLEELYNIGKMFTNITPVIEVNTNSEPAMYDVKFIGDKDYDFTLIEDLNLNAIVGGGVKVNTYKCIDSYAVSTTFGNSNLGKNKIKNYIERRPICDFIYNKIGNFGRNHLNEKDLGEEILIDFR